jgi:sec-independent protein translocase protein TatB
MLFDFSMTELMLIGVVALVVIGPKDLPKALRVAGFWVKKARTLSREFQTSVEQMIREAELDEMRKEFKKASELDIEKEFRNTIDPSGSLAEDLQPPQLPKFSEADLPATRKVATPPVAETDQTPTARPEPPVDAFPVSSDPDLVPPKAASPETATPGPPPSRE